MKRMRDGKRKGRNVMNSFVCICIGIVVICNIVTFEAQRKRIDYLENRIEMMERGKTWTI